jgi:hypothetical protein
MRQLLRARVVARASEASSNSLMVAMPERLP